MDEAKLHQFVGQMLSDLGGAASVALVRMGDAARPLQDIASEGADDGAPNWPRRPGSTSAICASGRRTRPPRTISPMIRRRSKFALPEEQAMVFAVDDSPVNMTGAFDLMVALLAAQDKVQEAFKTGGGVPWGDNIGLHVLRRREVLPAGIPQQSGAQLAAGARRRRRKAGARREGRRCRVRPRLVHRADGKGVPELAVHRLRLPSELDRAAPRRTRPNTAFGNTRFEVATAKEFPGRDLDLVDVLRLPARHGRSGRRGGACPAIAEAGRHLDDRRADGRRQSSRTI